MNNATTIIDATAETKQKSTEKIDVITMTPSIQEAGHSRISFTRLKAQGQRCIQLDALRGLAILLVLFHHMFALPHSMPAGPLRVILQTIKDNGWIGVDLFFVLSGFLVSGLLFDEFKRKGKMDLLRFLTRRAFKIYPGYYCFVAFSSVFLILLNNQNAPQVMPSMLLFFSNYTMADFDAGSNAMLMHGWSLAVEEHFYLLLAALFWGLTRSPKFLKLTPIICLLTCLLTVSLREFTFQHYPTWASARFATHLKIDALMFGVLLSYFYHFHRSKVENIFRLRERQFIPLSLLLITPCALFGFADHFTYVVGFTMLYLGCGIALLVWVVNPFKISIFTAMLSGLGTFSYSIYLWHRLPQLLIEAMTLGQAELYPLKQLLYFTCSIVGGILTTRLIELPALSLRDRLLPDFPPKSTGRSRPTSGSLTLSQLC